MRTALARKHGSRDLVPRFLIVFPSFSCEFSYELGGGWICIALLETFRDLGNPFTKFIKNDVEMFIEKCRFRGSTRARRSTL